MTYNEWLKEWFGCYVNLTVKRRTLNRYAEIVRLHIAPSLGNADIADLTPITLQKTVSQLLKSGNIRTGGALSSSAVNSVITVIRNSLEAAKDANLISSNPARNVKRPKAEEKRVECFTVEQQRKLENGIVKLRKKYFFGIIICLYTGLRIGELLALEWDDVDLSDGYMLINKTCYYGKNERGLFGRIVTEPKTDSSKRIIPIPRRISELLQRMKDGSVSANVIEKGGKPIAVRTYQRQFEVILQKLEIERKGFHSLRHTFATRAIESGMDVKTLSEILGHKSATVTLNRYTHSLWEHKKEMMEKLGGLYEKNAY